MADAEASAMEGTSASVAEMASSSGERTSAKGEGDALLRVSQGLVTSLDKSIEEFRDVESALELETTVGVVSGTSPDEAHPQRSVSLQARPEPFVVAGILKEMVGTLMSDIKANAEVQKLLPAMQVVSDANHHALFQGSMIPMQPSCSVSISPPSKETAPAYISSEDSRMAKGGAEKDQKICKHFCEHLEVVDPWLWKGLPHEMVELVVAKLPMPRIVGLRDCSRAWYRMSKSSTFGEACAESHSKLFGLVGWDVHCHTMWTALYDIKSKEWLWVALDGLPGSLPVRDWESDDNGDSQSDAKDSDAYQSLIYAFDGGLVCFVPKEHWKSRPILVCNPLTNIWKTLPVPPLEDFENNNIFMVQLVVADDTKSYRVILVCCGKLGEAFSAHFYDSRTRMWSTMDSGLVYGAGYEHHAFGPAQYVFDCTTKKRLELSRRATLGSIDYSMAKDRLFVLHASTEVSEESGQLMYLVSEFTWESSVSNLKEVNVSESPIIVRQGSHGTTLFATRDFVLLFSDWNRRQHIGLYDVSANQWDVPPPLPDDSRRYSAQLQKLFMCDLRWNITP